VADPEGPAAEVARQAAELQILQRVASEVNATLDLEEIYDIALRTMDELFEFLTLSQTHKLSRELAVVMYGSTYWREVLDFKPMVTWEAISPADLKCLTFCDSPDEAFGHLKKHLEAHYLTPQAPHEAQVPAIAKTS
jgi:hypothetical protein